MHGYINLPVLTYTLPILEESECAMPCVQMDPNDGPLSKPGGEVHLVSFVMQQALTETRRTTMFNTSYDGAFYYNSAVSFFRVVSWLRNQKRHLTFR